jgi:hypothetical protein
MHRHPGPTRLIPQRIDAALDVRFMDRFFDNYIMTPMQHLVSDRMRADGEHDATGVAASRAMLDVPMDGSKGRLHKMRGQPAAILRWRIAPRPPRFSMQIGCMRSPTVLAALDAIGIAPKSAEQTTTALIADSAATRHLGVDPASALLCIHRLIRDGEGRSIEHQSHIYRPDRCHLQARVAIERSSAGLRWSDAESPALPAWL